MMELNAIPRIPRGVRLTRDKVRQMDVLLAPERAIHLDPIGLAILNQIDNTRSFDEIVTNLSTQYNADRDEISGDVSEFITELAEKRILDILT